jgi:type I restriction enzyme S subunit
MKMLEGWNKIVLESVISLIQSGSRPKGGASSDHGDIPSLGGENIITSGGVSLSEVKLVPYNFYNRMTKGHLRHGDVLINKDGAQTGKVGYYQAPSNPPACINEHLFLLRGKVEQIEQKYLYYLLLSQCGQNQIRKQISGSAQPGLKSGFIKGIVADLPDSLPEQTKISEILSTVDRAIEQTEALITKQQRIKTGLMQDLLTRGIDEHDNLRSEKAHQFKDSPLGRIPAEWEIMKFGNATPENAPIGYGIVQPGVYDYTGVKIAGIYTINSDFQQWHMSSRKIEQAYIRSRIRAGDVLLSIKGTTGRVGVVPEGISGNISREIARIRPIKSINSYFLRFLMLTNLFQRYLSNAEVGTTRAELSIKILRELYIVVPPPPEQDKIVTWITLIEKTLESGQKELAKLRSIKTALMQDLLTGKKRVTPLLNDQEVLCR